MRTDLLRRELVSLSDLCEFSTSASSRLSLFTLADSHETSLIDRSNRDVTKLPAYFANVLGKPALPYLSALPLDLSSLPSNELRVFFTSTDSTITNDACSALPDTTPNLANYITVVQRGSCTFDQKMTNVAAKGGKVVLVYNSATASSSVPYLTPDGTGIVAVGSLRREEGLRLLSYYKQNSRGLRMAFTGKDKPTSVEDTISGGIMSYFSEFGPTFDLYGQPSASAPGGNILSTFPLSMGGLGVISGTSMSCPHVGESPLLFTLLSISLLAFNRD